MVTPPRKGDPHIVAAANLAGVDEIYTIGGAQAIRFSIRDGIDSESG